MGANDNVTLAKKKLKPGINKICVHNIVSW